MFICPIIIKPVTVKFSQYQLSTMVRYTELPINVSLMQYCYPDIPEEWVYGLEVDREFNIKDQNFTGVCSDYQQWFLDETYKDYI